MSPVSPENSPSHSQVIMNPLKQAIRITTGEEQLAILWSLCNCESTPCVKQDFAGYALSSWKYKFLFETEAIFSPAKHLEDAAATPKPWGRHQSLGPEHLYSAFVVNAQAMGIIHAEEAHPGFSLCDADTIKSFREGDQHLDGMYMIPMFDGKPLVTQGDRPSSQNVWMEVFEPARQLLIDKEVPETKIQEIMTFLCKNARKYAVVGCQADWWTSPVHASIRKLIRRHLGIDFANNGIFVGGEILEVLTDTMLSCQVQGVKEGVGESTKEPVPFSSILDLHEDSKVCMQLVGAALAAQEGHFSPDKFDFVGVIQSTKYKCSSVRGDKTENFVSRKELKVDEYHMKGRITSCVPYTSVRAMYTYRVDDLARFNEGHMKFKYKALQYIEYMRRADSQVCIERVLGSLDTNLKRTRKSLDFEESAAAPMSSQPKHSAPAHIKKRKKRATQSAWSRSSKNMTDDL